MRKNYYLDKNESQRTMELDKKEELIKSILKERGNHPGLIAVLSDLELCNWSIKQIE